MKRKKKLRVYFSTETHKEHVVAYIRQKSLNNDLKRIEDEKSFKFFCGGNEKSLRLHLD
jgi:hypothetical protein